MQVLIIVMLLSHIVSELTLSLKSSCFTAVRWIHTPVAVDKILWAITSDYSCMCWGKLVLIKTYIRTVKSFRLVFWKNRQTRRRSDSDWSWLCLMLTESFMLSVRLTLHAFALLMAVIAPRFITRLLFTRALFNLVLSVWISILLLTALLWGTAFSFVINESMIAVCRLGWGRQAGDC